MNVNVLDMLAVQVVGCQDFGGNRPFATVKPWGAQVYYFNADNATEDPVFAVDGASILRECAKPKDQGGAGAIAGVYFVMPRDSSEYAAGYAYASRCSKRVEELGGGAVVQAVLVDVEKVPLGFQAGFMERWDVIRFGRPTLYSVEPFQDRTQNDYPRMLQRNTTAGRRLRKVTHQSYFGGMQPLPPHDVAAYLTDRGLSPDDLCPTIDPAQPAPYIASAAAAAERGAVLFEAGRIPR